MSSAIGSASVGSRGAPTRSAGGLTKRKSAAAPAGGAGAAPRAVRSSGSSAGILRFYTEDAEGLKVQPMAVIIFSFAYIGCVVLLHLWGKFIRG
ncbi:Arf guanine nucleotide exchange factor sbh1 [Balamuthia mandrillaris]